MPIRFVTGDLFSTDAKYICHQVNCQGKMGSGVAKQVREKFPMVFENYKAVCDRGKEDSRAHGLGHSVLLGDIQIITVHNDKEQSICNLFAQDRYGYNGERYTSYDAFYTCMSKLMRVIPTTERIAIPYRIGCGLGGGDWGKVLSIISMTIGQNHHVEIWRLPNEQI